MSTIRVDNFGPSAGGTTYSAGGIAKAWGFITGGATPALSGSLNLSSVTDDGLGLYGPSFTNAMADANFSTHGSCDPRGSGANVSVGDYGRTTTGVDIAVEGSGGGGTDRDTSVTVTGDLA